MKSKAAPIEDVFKILRDNYKTKEPELKPFDSLIFTILSQRSRDENTEKAAQKLLEAYPTPQALSK
ncbi:MAG: endonuclease III, partial [Candidatus Thermoplasmatota archaeon]|nr:endonuclease III [Candidatus Thermoplasmatota archaeon]